MSFRLARHGSAGDPTLKNWRHSARNLYQRRFEVGGVSFFFFLFPSGVDSRGFIMTTVPARLTWELFC